jgi:hypothetical protein
LRNTSTEKNSHDTASPGDDLHTPSRFSRFFIYTPMIHFVVSASPEQFILNNNTDREKMWECNEAETIITRTTIKKIFGL